jgi:segregation and condensation protein B
VSDHPIRDDFSGRDRLPGGEDPAPTDAEPPGDEDVPRLIEPDRDHAKPAIEAVLMAALEPVEPGVLAQLLELPVADVELACRELTLAYEQSGRGFVLVRVAGGYRYQTHADFAPYVERFVLVGQHARLSQAALETLAIIAYKQPVSRVQLSAIRGVNVDAVLRTLLQRGYVEEVGRDPGPGTPVLFGTTGEFLEHLGLDSLDDLPPLPDFVPAPEVVEALERGLRFPTEPPPEARATADEE